MHSPFISTRLLATALILATGGAYAQNATPLRTELLAEGLDHPWALAFIGDGRILLTERSGDMLSLIHI